MPTFLGIDIGTSSTKVIVAGEDGAVLASASRPYPLHTPRAGWSEQDPEDWWRATLEAVREAVGLMPPGAAPIAGVGMSGQMHGLVLLPRGAGPQTPALRRAILWNDQRTAPQCEAIHRAMGSARALIGESGNVALPGFTAPKLLWVREHEPEVFARAGMMLTPKDFIRLRLTGVAAMDVGDATGTLLVDPRTRDWNRRTIDALRLDPAMFPAISESAAAAGTVLPSVAQATGLPTGVPVAAGSGDNMTGAVGAGIVRPGRVLAAIGTSGVIVAHLDRLAVDLPSDPAQPAGRIHTFAAADGTARTPGGYCLAGCTLSAGGALQWLRDALFPGVAFETLMHEAAGVMPGSEGLLFLPTLSGERAPFPDPLARGCFVGLSLRHGRGHLVRAVIEGVTFSMRLILDIHRELGVTPGVIRLGGGGARSELWRQMQADVYRSPVALTNTEEGPALGAALLGGVAAGYYASVQAACDHTVRETLRLEPDPSDRYGPSLDAFRGLYPDLRERFRAIAKIPQA